MAMMLVEERHPFHHPRFQPGAGVLCDLANDVQAVAQPLKLAARRRRKDRDLTIFALKAVLQRDYVLPLLAIESETSLSTV
jgi:hypothetical protein